MLKEAGIPAAKFLSFAREEKKEIKFPEMVSQLGLPFFVKPATLGSSVGISKFKKEEEFFYALEEAFRYDGKILIEEYVEGREIECAVLGNEKPRVSCPGEIIPGHEFYSYEAKYIDPETLLQIPLLFRKYSRENTMFGHSNTRALSCEDGQGGLSQGEKYCKRLNTIQVYFHQYVSKLWEASGIPYPQLIDELIQLALERREKEGIANFHKLVTNRS